MITVMRLLVFALGLLTTAPSFCQPKVMPRLGVLVSGTASSAAFLVEAFRQGLESLGYFEGRTIHVEYRYSDSAPDRQTELADQLMQSKPDLLFAAGGNDIALALKRVAGNTPIVMAGGSDPIGAGLIKGLARPGGNISGLTSLSARLTEKRLALVRELVPGVNPIAVLYNPESRQKRAEAAETARAAGSLGIQIRLIKVRRAEEIAPSIALAAESGVDALSVLSDTFTRVHGETIGALALARRLPTMFADRQRMEHAGGLVSYGPDYAQMWRRAATYVDKILKGANPADLPVEQPTDFTLAVNLKTAEALGVAIPESILVRANEVIE